jgi:hypothetical protein
MITSFEVGAVFKIINEASPALKTMLKQVRDLTAAVEKAKVGLASLNKELLPSSGLTAAVAETDKLANAWRKVAAESGAARRAIGSATSASARAALPPSVGGGGGGGGRHQPGFMARGGGGAHVGGPLVPIPGGGHLRFGGAGAATAGLIGYGAYEAAQMEDAVWQLVYHSGVENNDANKAKFRKILQDGMRTSGYGVHDIAESAKQEIRMFQGTPGGGIDVLPEMLRAATIEARVKGESPEESMKALIGLAHMTKQYSPEAIKKLAPAFAFLSTANPGSLSSIERAAGYAVPLLQSGLEIDPMQSLLLGTALTRAGATSTKSGTWLREMALRAMPGTSLMSKMAYKKHEAALKEVGLSDDEGKPTWFTDGKPDLLKMLDIGGAGAAKIPLTRRAGIERSLFGAQGGGGFALLADPAVREQILALQKEMNSPEFKNRYGGFMESYNGQVTSQNARTALQYFNVTMQDIGQHTLPVVNHVLRDFKDTLAAVRGILPSKVISNGETIATRAAEGALAGGLIGAFTGPGAIVGAGAGGMLGAAEGFMETYGHGVGMDKGGSYSSPGKTGRPAQPIVVKPQPITLNLNVDGRALASAVTDAMGNQTGFSTQAPAADGLGIFGSGDHDYKDH